MYTVIRLYRVTRSTIAIYTPEECTPATFQSYAELNTTLYIAVADSESAQRYSLNYSRLITDYDIAHLEAWNDVGSALTEALILGYQEYTPGYAPGADQPSTSVVLWDAMSTLNTFNLNYADNLSGVAAIEALRYSLLDLSIRLQPEPAHQVPLEKCLPIVNGLACRPKYDQQSQTLYCIGGAQLCWQGGVHHTPEVQLLDFSQLGDISIHPISLTTHKDPDVYTVSFANSNNTFNLDADWLFANTQFSLYEYTPLVVIAGSVFFPDEYQVVDEHTFRMSLQTHAFDILLAYRRYLTDEANSEAEICFTGETETSYLRAQMTGEHTSDTFIVLVKTPRLWVTRTKLDVWMNGITINAYTPESILHHRRTNTIRVYHVDTYTDKKELTLQNMEPLLTSDYNCYQGQLAFVRPDCRHHSFQDLHKGPCEMIYLVK